MIFGERFDENGRAKVGEVEEGEASETMARVGEAVWLVSRIGDVETWTPPMAWSIGKRKLGEVVVSMGEKTNGWGVSSKLNSFGIGDVSKEKPWFGSPAGADEGASKKLKSTSVMSTFHSGMLDVQSNVAEGSGWGDCWNEG
jgi:hypothetical protein